MTRSSPKTTTINQTQTACAVWARSMFTTSVIALLHTHPPPPPTIAAFPVCDEWWGGDPPETTTTVAGRGEILNGA